MEKEELEKIRGWFNQVLQETSKIRGQNLQIEDWMEPTYGNVRMVYDMCDNLGNKLDRLDSKLSALDKKIDLILEKTDK